MDGSEFIRIVTRDNEECFLLTKLKAGGNEGLDLTVFHNGSVWTGQVSEDDLDDLSSRRKMKFDKYVKQTVEALASNGDKDTFQYQLRRQKDTAEFIWKKHVADEDITLGSATLMSRPDSALYITKMFGHCIKTMVEIKQRIYSLETDNERLSQERMNALKRLEKCVVAKEELENDLYSKFTYVLNSKKAKIRELKRHLEEGITPDQTKDTGSDLDEPSQSTSRTKRSRSPEEIMAENSNSDPDTDDEKPKQKRVKASQSRPSPAKFDRNDSLVLGADEEESSRVTRPKRQRGRPQKKQTPSKPILPRVGSNESDPGSERKTRMKKNSSSNSNKSSDNIDADDLLNDL